MFKAFRRARRHSSVLALVGAAALVMFAGSVGQPVAAFGAPTPVHPVVASPPPARPVALVAPRKPAHRGPVAVIATVPTAPAQNVQVTATTAGSATLTWGAADFAGDTNQTYTVLVNGTAFPACTSISALTCRVTGAARAQVSLVVRAIGDNSQYLNAAAVTTTLLPPPDAPAISSATASGNDQAVVNWTAPGSWHLSNNKTYSVLVDGALYPSCTNITALTCTFSGSDGPHAVTVRALGDPGLATDSTPVNVALVNAPDKPTGIHLTASDAGTGTIVWTAPANWHNSVNRKYTVKVDGAAVSSCTNISPTTCAFSADDFTVSVVVTAIGDVPTLTTDSDPVTLTLLPPPNAPTGLQQSAWGVGQVTVHWSAVNFNGSGNNQYTVSAGGSPVSGCVNLPSTTLSCVVSGTPDSTTPVVVTAIGDVGLSQDSAPLTVELPAVPDAPTGIHATVWSATQTRVSWTAPTSWHHNTHNTSYAVSVTGASGATACAATTNTYCDIVGGADNAASVTVSAIGDAPALKTDATASIDLPGAPDVPTNLHATATGSGTATIAWTEPNWRHNSANQTYVVTVSGTPVVCAHASVASCDITGSGTVPVTVQAVGDDAGTLSSAASAPVDFALIAAPTGAVDTVTVTPTPGNSHLTVEWPTLTSSMPSGDWQGGAVKGYKVVITAPNGATVNPDTCAPSVADPASGTAVSCSFSTDTDGHYSVRVIAVNEAGPSISYTDGVADLVLHAPAAGVAHLAATSVPASGHVAVSWDQLTGTVWNGATTRTYAVTVDSPAGATLTTDTCSPPIADGSTPVCAFDTNTAGLYTIHVKPHSEAGLGTVDTTTTVTVALTAPSAAVTGLTATHAGSGVINVAWTGIADAAWAGAVHHYDVHVDAPMGTTPQITNSSCALLATTDASSAASCEFTTDTPGSYTITVTPVNEVGASAVAAPTATAHVTLNMPSAAVTSLHVANTPGSPAVTVTWDQLGASAWQSAATRNYTVAITSKPAGATIDVNTDTCTTVADSATPTCTFNAPLAGDYQVQVVPTSEAGNGPQAVASGHVTLAAPTGTIGAVTVSTSPGDSLVNLTWPELADAGWSSGQPASRHYTVVIPGNLNATSSTCASVPDSSTPGCHFSTTVPGSFTITVKAVNEAGTAATGTDGTGNIVFAPTVGVAGLAGVQASAGSKTVQVTWTTLGGSDWNGGTTKKYHVVVTPPVGVTLANDHCQTADIADGANPGCTFDAPLGDDYTVTVLPKNEAGLSTASASPGVLSHVVLVPTATVSNLHVVTTPGSHDVTVVWNRAATADWNGAVTTHNYLAAVTKPNGAVLTNDDCDGTVVDTAHPTCGFTADTSGTYTVTVALANEAGTSLATSTATATLALNPPSVTVTGLTVTSAPGSGLVQVGWTGIASAAWQGVTHHYVVTVTSPAGATLTSNTCPALATSDATSATGCSFSTGVAGDYSVTVAAANEAGTGTATAPQTGHVTLAAPTGPVVHLAVVATAGSPTVNVTWDQLTSAAWQSSVTKEYTVVVTKPSGANVSASTCTTVTDSAHPGCSFTTDTAGAYQVSVAPDNEAGTGTAAQQAATVVLTVPTGPVGVITVDNTPSSGVVNLSWPQLGDAAFNYGMTRSYAVTIAGGLTLSANTCVSVVDSATPHCSFTATTPGAFTATVKAVNELGTAVNGTDGSGNVSFHPTAAVVNLTATAPAGSTTAQVSWNQLVAANWLGGTNRRYAVSVSVPTGANLTADSCDGSVPDGANPQCSFTGSLSGQYTVHVTPVTEAGAGAIQDLPVTLSFGVPGPATAVSGVAGTNAIDVSWTGPDGAHQGSGLTSYAVTATAANYPTASCAGTVTTSPCTITGLAAGVAYTLHVIAAGPGGNSVDAASAATVAPLGAPAAPTAVPNTAVVVGSTTAPAGTGITITGSGFAPNSTVVLAFYTVPIPLTTVTASSTGTISVTVNVPNGVATGSHTLLATGVDANGAVRYLADAVTVAATTPPVNNPPVNNPPTTTPPAATAPTGTVGSLTARQTSSAGRSVLVSWGAGSVAWGTGSTRSYAVTVDGPDGADVTGTCTAPVAGSGTSCTFSTDTNGSYRVSVLARTEAGSSTNSAATSVTVTLAAVPAAPATAAGKASANAITVSWTASATPGAVVTGYLVTASASGYPSRSCAATVTRSPCTIGGLSGGVGYAVQVVAVGKVGNSPARTVAADVVPTGNLIAPTAIPAGSVSAGSRTVAAGAKVSISGTGFKARTAVQLRLYPAGVSMGSGTATASGGFSATVTVPKGTAGGTYTLLAFGLNPGNRARFVREGVVVPGTRGTAVHNSGHHQHSAGMTSTGTTKSTATGSKTAGSKTTGSKATSTGTMAVTGPAGGPVILAGFTFIIAGLAVTVSARRRRRTRR